ncbi:MAG: hypothetical protein KatS3mg050_1830 [Litorilinea sp.]|nr:MAG: hypothetical protein KatS3mg050_1830 [Litorilinea sp.]
MGGKVTPRQRKAIEALLTTGSITEASQAAGVARKTIYAWLKRDEFRAELHEAEAQALQSLSLSLVRLGEKAARTLGEAMDGERESTRVRAADIVLQRLLQLRELVALEERVAALEQAIGNKSG